MKTNPMFIDIHVLQTVPPSNINRDDTGSPKTAQFGGVTRARVSSQAWKKAARDLFPEMLDVADLGQRTKYAVGLIAESIVNKEITITSETAEEMASGVLSATGIKVGKRDDDGRLPTGYLLFISPAQIDALADLALEARAAGAKIEGKKAKAVLDIKQNPLLNACDIALFGRMVADAPDLNVDASTQVAHAIGVSRMETEFDYFTAVDDCSLDDNAGAGMIGTVEFSSSLLYRYATLDVLHLFENLGSAKTATKTVEAFIKAFVISMPTGKQNSFANRTLPSVIVVQLRDTQPVSLVNAFEVPVCAISEAGQTKLACKALVIQEKLIDEAFGTAPMKSFVVRAAQNIDVLDGLENAYFCTLAELMERIAEELGSYLGQYESVEEGI